MTASTSTALAGTSRILIVDDDPLLCTTYQRIMSLKGYHVQIANSFHTAAALLKSQTYDTIIADILLGESDGLNLLEQSRELNPDTPVILMTGFPSVETASDAVRLNAYEYLIKPVSKERLLQTVGRAVELNMLRKAKRRAALEKQNYQRDLERQVALRTEKLNITNQRYQLLFENSKDAIYMAGWDGRFLALNKAVVHLFGYDRNELMQVSALSLYVDPKRHQQFQTEIKEHGFVKDFNVRFTKKNGKKIDCLMTAHLLVGPDGQSEGYQGIIRDITQQKRAEHKIQRQNAFLNNVIESLAHPFMVIDTTDYKVIIANAAARRHQTAKGSTCYALNHMLAKPCGTEGLRCSVDRVVETHRPVHMEHVHRDLHGNEREHEVHAFPLFDQEGQVKQVIQYCIDINEKKRLVAIAEAANLMDNLGYIFAGIRHEIGNPINSIKMALSVLDLNLNRYPRETIREFVGRALGDVSRVEYLLKALKNFSMFETLHLESVSMEYFFNNFMSLVDKDFSQKGVRIELNMPDKDILVQTDHRAFHQVMLNLLTNAADALEKTEHPRIDISVRQKGELVQVQVKDNGSGMSEGERKNLFRPFYTSKLHGTGLGLVIVKKMLSKMNGTIRLDSKRQAGTTITITLPRGAK